MTKHRKNFRKTEHYTPKTKQEKMLIKALLNVKSEKHMANLLRDMLTLTEIEEFANRYYMAHLLAEGKLSYREIAEKLNTSTTTVARVAHWLYRGCGGYWKSLK